MAPAPLPPHERHWRHPSEIGPTAVDIDTTPNGRGLVLATGAAAALLAAVMVVALTPPPASSPSAISATTIPSATIRIQSMVQAEDAFPARGRGVVRIDRNTVSRDNALTLRGAPNVVSAVPADDASEMSLASDLPGDDERIIVLTFSYTYDIAWSQIERVAAPDGSIVMTHEGELVATFVDGALRLLVS